MEAITKVFLDTNVLLDLVDRVRPNAQKSVKIVEVAEGLNISLCCSALSLINLAYILRSQQADLVRKAIEGFLLSFEVQDLNSEDIQYALTLPMDDFEDAFQWVAAKKCGASHVVSNDKHFLLRQTIGMPLINSPDTMISILNG
jgi:predicted nucleic acid-binding protein